MCYANDLYRMQAEIYAAADITFKNKLFNISSKPLVDNIYVTSGNQSYLSKTNRQIAIQLAE